MTKTDQKFAMVLNRDVRFGAQDYTKGTVLGHIVPASGFTIRDIDKSLARGEVRAEPSEVNAANNPATPEAVKPRNPPTP